MSGSLYCALVFCPCATSAARGRLRGVRRRKRSRVAAWLPERHRPGEAGRRAATRPACAHRACPVWPCAMEGCHGERMAQATGDFLGSAELGKPVPGKHACDRDAKTLPVGRNGREAGCRSGGHMAVHQERTSVAQDADSHGPGMQGKTTIKSVWVGVEAPEVFSSFGSDCSQAQHTIGGMWRRRPQLLSRGCSRLPPASAALPLPIAAEAWRCVFSAVI
jgi:hypothetical protein